MDLPFDWVNYVMAERREFARYALCDGTGVILMLSCWFHEVFIGLLRLTALGLQLCSSAFD